MKSGTAPDATDPVDRESARVQAVVAYFAGTDNLNLGAKSITIADHFGSLGQPTGEFDFHDSDAKENRHVRITEPANIRERFRAASPITHVNGDTPPVLSLHGQVADKIDDSSTLSGPAGVHDERGTTKAIVSIKKSSDDRYTVHWSKHRERLKRGNHFKNRSRKLEKSRARPSLNHSELRLMRWRWQTSASI